MNIRMILMALFALGTTTFCKGQMEPVANDEPQAKKALVVALELAAERAIAKVSAEGGFSRTPEIRIALPQEAAEMKKTLSKMGLQRQIEQFEEDMNSAAEQAAGEARDIMINAITTLSLADATKLLGANQPDAATAYLKTETEVALLEKIGPRIEDAMGGTKVIDSWQQLTSTYNKIPFTRAVETDLKRYLSEQTLHGIFYEMSKQEQRIRRDPAARTTDLLNLFFGKP